LAKLNLEHIRPLREKLIAHPIYGAIRDRADLAVFMEHHIFSVWDFMSLIKYLQGQIAPSQTPWVPRGNPAARYFINQLVLEEESDRMPGDDGEPRFGSHFELYCEAMDEVGANADRARRFIELVQSKGVDEALYSELTPLPARYFSETTFCFIRENKPHLVGAALAVGRERLIPDMFRHFLEQMGITATDAPSFHYYLKRHIYLDGDFHGPLSMSLLESLCGDDPQRITEAETAAEEALCARIRFWDGVHEEILARRGG